MNLFEFRLHVSVLALAILLYAGSLQAQAAEKFVPRRIKSASGVTYTLFPQGDLTFEFVVSRPAKTRSDIYLCIPSAFTTADDRVDGVYISNGSIGNASGVNKALGGAMVIQVGRTQLLSTDKGSMITQGFLKDVQRAHGSLFQQFLIVHEGQAASIKDKSKFQRRAVYQNTKGAFGVVESDVPITFSMFSDDLVALGMKEALYCDMGAWDEGWYRSGAGKVTTIGLDRSLTNRQSNWLLLKAPEELSLKKLRPKKLLPKSK